ncbi:class V lanthionine synthetase subunit LxmK [Nocardia sp. NPDC051570]|uniref:class V lanthionine synthetase subunit LxmK n=1 Tax=Nocardia sp. NPDC051570 TaxID=3364324 RepID=UPI0037B818B8
MGRFLNRLGLGDLDAESVVSTLGRNPNWIGQTTRGGKVFVKELVLDDERRAKIARTVHVAATGEGLVNMPRLVGVDEDEALIATDYVNESRNGLELAGDSVFDDQLCEAVAEQLANFHRLPAEGFDPAPHPMPPLKPFEAVSLEYFAQASAAEIAMWKLLQPDQELRAALRTLREIDDDPPTPRCPIHGDLRLDQFLIADGVAYLSDFEEARLGDPARDIGAFAGEWLFLAASALPETLADSLPLGASAAHEQIVATGVGEVAQRSPKVRAFYRRYLACRPQARDDRELATRAARYAGWHMIDRMLAGAGQSARLSPINRAAAGIGRTVLLSPAEFVSILGLEE